VLALKPQILLHGFQRVLLQNLHQMPLFNIHQLLIGMDSIIDDRHIITEGNEKILIKELIGGN
jgi:hypothetical protein